MKNEKKIKKIPILSYLCYLLAVSVLFTGVTFSRYTAFESTDLSSSISPFIASYEIDDISSSSFTNADYWMESGGALGTSRTVRFTLRNYLNDESAENGIGITSDINLNAALRLCFPAELADNLVLQVAVSDPVTNAQTAVTPQYKIGNLLYEVAENEKGEYGYAYVGDPENKIKQFASHGENSLLYTQKFTDYMGLPCQDETLLLQGGLSSEGIGFVSAVSQNSGNSVTLTAATQRASYAVGFRRGESQNDFRQQLYVHLEKEIPFYTVDIDLGDIAAFVGGTPVQKSFVLYVTLAERIKGEDYGREWLQDNDAWLTPPSAGSAQYNFNGAAVAGYHFDVEAPTYIYTASEGFVSREVNTSVRIRGEYGRGESAYSGENATSYWHVAPVSENSGADYVHKIEYFFTLDSQNGILQKYQFDSSPLQNRAVYGLCSNYLNALRGAFDENGNIVLSRLPENNTYFFIGLAGLPDSPFYASYQNQQEGKRNYSVYESLSKNYATKMSAVFVQDSAVRGGAGV